METKLELLITDKKLRNSVKENARNYFEEELSPEKIIKKIKDLHQHRFK